MPRGYGMREMYNFQIVAIGYDVHVLIHRLQDVNIPHPIPSNEMVPGTLGLQLDWSTPVEEHEQ